MMNKHHFDGIPEQWAGLEPTRNNNFTVADATKGDEMGIPNKYSLEGSADRIGRACDNAHNQAEADNTAGNDESLVERTQALCGSKMGEQVDSVARNSVAGGTQWAQRHELHDVERLECILCTPRCKLPFGCGGRKEPGVWTRFEHCLTDLDPSSDLACVFTEEVSGDSTVFELDKDCFPSSHNERKRYYSPVEIRAYTVKPAISYPAALRSQMEDGMLVIVSALIPCAPSESSLVVALAFTEVVDVKH